MSPPKKCVEVPAVPEGIPYARRAVAIGLVRWRLNGDGPSPQGLRVHGVSVWDINVQQAGLWLILSVGFVDFEIGRASCRERDWSSDVCSSDLCHLLRNVLRYQLFPKGSLTPAERSP